MLSLRLRCSDRALLLRGSFSALLLIRRGREKSLAILIAVEFFRHERLDFLRRLRCQPRDADV